MEAALDLEDDLFFADLSKQISLLIMDDDDDDDDDEDSLARIPSVNLQAFSRRINPGTQATYLNYDQQTQKRGSKGTGVFIPRSLHPKRKNSRQGKFRSSSNNKKVESPSTDKYSRGLPHMAYNNNSIIGASYHSVNHRTY